AASTSGTPAGCPAPNGEPSRTLFPRAANNGCDATTETTGTGPVVMVTQPSAAGLLTDAQLIERARRTPEHFTAIFDRHYRNIYAYVARRLGPDLAEDVASETFLTAFDRRHSYDLARGDARPWLYGIASNLVARHVRAESRRYRALARAGGREADTTEHDDAVAGRLDAAAVRG